MEPQSNYNFFLFVIIIQFFKIYLQCRSIVLLKDHTDTHRHKQTQKKLTLPH